MKVLAVPIIVDNSPQTALRNAIRNISTEYREYSWCEARDRGEDTGTGILQAAREFNPDLVFMQLQDPTVISVQQMAEFSGVKVVWNGDVRDSTPEWAVELGRVVDISLFTNLRDVEFLRSVGINADYLQIGYDENIYFPDGDKISTPDIVFLGANYGDAAFPLSQYRREMIEHLYTMSIYGPTFEAYGHCQKNSLLREKDEATLLRSAKIVINLSHYSIDRYSSDRLWRALGSGVMVLSHNYPGIQQEFQIGHHLDVWDSLSELENKINYYLDNSLTRIEIAKNGYHHALKTSTWKARIKDNLLPLLERRGLI